MRLSINKIDYIFEHLRQHWLPEKRLTDAFLILDPDKPVPENHRERIIFRLSDQEVPQVLNLYDEGERIPVLFPLSDDVSLFKMDEDGNLWFCHDYLSSAFYLLSGMQELDKTKLDEHKRFSYSMSIQKSYDFISKPVVNYYFEIILKGFECFAKRHNIVIKRQVLFPNFGFLLSHDVDRVAFHHPRNLIYKTLLITGIRPCIESKSKIFKHVLSGLRYHLKLFGGKDPWWNFQWMIDLEMRLGIRSVFFFLHKEEGFKNAWYRFSSAKIKDLISVLKDKKFEVGVHGTFKSSTNYISLVEQKNALMQVYGEEPIGIRQHFLCFSLPLTFNIQESAGFTYDSSLTFHDHDGYRNSYCYPFHPYDFDNDCILRIWEIPLVMMEVSALQYRQLSFNELREEVQSYIREAKKFGGLFSLLWHNCRLYDEENAGVSEFYEGLLEEIVDHNPDSLTGAALMQSLRKD